MRGYIPRPLGSRNVQEGLISLRIKLARQLNKPCDTKISAVALRTELTTYIKYKGGSEGRKEGGREGGREGEVMVEAACLPTSVNTSV